MKRFVYLQVFIVLLGLLIGLVGRYTFKDEGVAGISCVEDIEKLDCNLYYLYTDAEYESYKGDYFQGLIKECDEASDVLVVEPTDKIIQNDFSILQEAKVISSIKGGAKENDIILFQSIGGVSTEFSDAGKYGNNNPVIFHFPASFMQQGNRYLVFCETTAINNYVKEKIYHRKTTFFPYLNLTKNDSHYVKDSISYNAFKDSEFFCDSERMLELVMKYKKEIVNKYAKGFVEYNEEESD